jgi:hypothetical protein|tara:strand:- start:725 stop:1873 length:1149 start_codon:yes stop_codon:yes gene_type:complete
MAGMSFEEYVNAYYGGTLGISKRYGISKADDNIDTSGLAEGLNTVFGAKVFNQLNTKSEVFKLLKKEAWTQSGFRALTARHATTAGVAEGGAFPETDHPELKEITLTLKEVVTPWQMSSKAEILSEADDGLGNLAAFMRKEQGEAHAFFLDDMLTKSVEANSDGATGAGQAGNNMESLDRVTATLAYVTDAQSPSNSQDDCDMYGLDISSNAFFDAGHTHFTDDGTNNALALDDLDTMIAALLENGANYNDLVMLTGYDTYQNLKALMQGTNGAFKFDLAGAGAANQNGVTGEAGFNFDSRVGAYDGIPIFLSQHVPKDGASRLYMLDMASLAMRVAAPTTYVDNTNLAVRQVLSREYAFITAGELVAYKRSTSGSIRDLTA